MTNLNPFFEEMFITDLKENQHIPLQIDKVETPSGPQKANGNKINDMLPIPMLQGSTEFDHEIVKKEKLTRFRIDLLPKFSNSRYELSEPETIETRKPELVEGLEWKLKSNTIITSFEGNFEGAKIVSAKFMLGESNLLSREFSYLEENVGTIVCVAPFNICEIVLDNKEAKLVYKKITQCNYVWVKSEGTTDVVEKLIYGYTFDSQWVKKEKVLTIPPELGSITYSKLYDDIVISFRLKENLDFEISSLPLGYLLFKGEININDNKISLTSSEESGYIECAVIVRNLRCGIRLLSLSKSEIFQSLV